MADVNLKHEDTTMKSNLRSLAITVLSSGLIAIGSSIAVAQSMNNADNTSPGESGHGTGCSNVAGGCQSPVSKWGSSGTTYNSNMGSSGMSGSGTTGTGTMVNNSDNTTSGESGHGTGCSNASGGSPSNCVNGVINN